MMGVRDIMASCQVREPVQLPSGETVVVVRRLRFLPMTIPGGKGRPSRVNKRYLRSNYK